MMDASPFAIHIYRSCCRYGAIMSLTLDPRTTALVLVDLQNGILGLPLAPYGASAILDASLRLGRRFAERGGAIFPVRVAFAPDFGDRPGQAVDEPMRAPPGGLPAEWSTLSPDIAALPATEVITKHQWGAFHDTGLDLQLRRRGITTLVLCGIVTNFGVESTAREAWQHNYAVVVAEDACTSMSEEMHRFSIKTIMPRIAQVRSCEAILSALG